MTVPELVLELVERFERNRAAYRSGRYKETRARAEFIDPLFVALGWDVHNVKGYAEAYKDVVHEDAIKVGGATKAPDYCFRIGGARKFFVEAKKPSVSIKEDVHPAYQLRRYAWSAKLPLSILTDFEELAVYDCRVRPVKTDSASTARVMYLTYRDYARGWEELAEIFAREAVLKGSFDRYAESTRRKRGTAEVDEAFLGEIEAWRELLARNIALRNPDLTQRELNFAVQRTIDRVVFLRICEDRGVEPYGRMRELLDGEGVYEGLVRLFRRADERYDSGLFYFGAEKGRADLPDELTPALALDDRPLKQIIGGLYYPDSPYEFSVLPADILGQVYEQFLGKVIRLTPRHRAVVETKPEVKKAGGVYYTPTYVVDYIVRHTLGQLLEGKTPRTAAGLKCLDPACGSGSFLLGAYQYLLDWYRDQYVADDPGRWARSRPARLFQADRPSTGSGQGDWRLTTAERKRVLLEHIYGVDIDRQAVEVTKLSLLLKVLEGESEETLATQLGFFQERALPDLADNVKCGNSLIGPDFYTGRQMGLLDAEERYRVNVFDWQAEFPEVMGRGGFDVVIGNPPYIRIQALKEWAPLEVEFYKQRYAAASKGNYDIYVVFVEKALELLNEQGRMGYILPHKFFQAKYGQPLRGVIAGGQHLAKVVHFGDQQVFSGATTYTCLLFLDKEGNQHFHFVEAHDLDAWRVGGEAVEGEIPTDKVTENEWNFVVGPGTALFERLGDMPVKLEDVAARLAQGIRTSANEIYVLDLVSTKGDMITAHSKQLGRDVELERRAVRLFLRGREIKPYRIQPSGKVVIMPYVIAAGRVDLMPEQEMRRQYPRAFSYLLENKKCLEDREKGRFKGPNWYGYGRLQNIDLMLLPKILVPDIADRASFALDEEGQYTFVSGYGITLKDDVSEATKYILGLLNSKTLDFYLKQVSTTLRGGFFRYFTQFIEQLPIRTIDFSNPPDEARHDRMVELVEGMLALHEELAAARTAHEQRAIQRQIDATDRRIDELVYELYGLSEEEIQIVEEATR
jgi:predicted type IV restriction endonuclease